MREPWDLARDFISNMQQQAAQSRQTADTALMRMIQANVARQDAQTQQGYSMDTLAKRNEYSTQADTVAFDRQLQRDDRAFEQQNQTLDKRRGFDIEDRNYTTQQRKDQTILEQQLMSEREAAQGLYPGFNMSRYSQGTVGRESGGNPNARNPNSSAGGLHQFTDGTWAAVMRSHPELGLTPDGKFDAAQSERAFDAFTADNQQVLKSNGIPITNGTTYAAHFLGAGGAVRALRAPDNTPMAAVTDPAAMKANSFLQGMTVGQFKQWTEKKYGGSGPVPTDQGARRYTDGDAGFNPTTEILGLPVGNATSRDMTQPSDAVAAYLNERGMEVVRPFMATEAQLDLLPPELKENIIPDPYANAPSNKRAPSVYYEVRPRANDGAGAQVQGVPQTKTTQGPSVEIKESKRRYYKDGKLTTDDGTEVQLPD